MIDLTGKIIGNLLVLHLTKKPYKERQPRLFVAKSSKTDRHRYWKCKCWYCDTEYILRSNNINKKRCKCRR